MNDDNSILVGWVQDVFWVRVENKGSVRNSGPLALCFDAMLRKGMSHCVVDLENCPTVDSTFIGTLSGMQKKLRKVNPAGEVHVIHLNSRCEQLFEDLGMKYFLTVDTLGARWEEESKLVRRSLTRLENEADINGLDRKERIGMILQAHEDLAEANPDNVPRFQDVIGYLRNELEESKKDPN